MVNVGRKFDVETNMLMGLLMLTGITKRQENILSVACSPFLAT
jgi:hypothetical protein